MISGNIDTDRNILLQMDDKELLKNCSLNKYYRDQVCNEEFWKKRTQLRLLHINKPSHVSWKDWYAINSSQLLEPHLYKINAKSTTEKELVHLLESIPLKRGDIVSIKHQGNISHAFIMNTNPLGWERLEPKNIDDSEDFIFPKKSTKIIEKIGLDKYRPIFIDLMRDLMMDDIIIRLEHRFIDDYYIVNDSGDIYRRKFGAYV